MKTYKRLLSALLVLLMCVSLFPVSAFAADEEVEPAEAAEAVESAEPAEDPAEPAAEEAEGEVAISSGTYPTLISATGTQVSATETQYNMLYVYSVSVIPGVPTQLSVTASSDSSLSYNWMSLEQGSQPQDIEGADSNTLTITCTADSTTQYMCRVYDEDYNALIVQFQLAVGSYPGLTLDNAAGTLINSGTNTWTFRVSANPGTEVSLWVRAGGLSEEAMANVTYVWAVFVPDGNGNSVETPTGDTSDTLPSFVLEEDCLYKCNIFDGQGGSLEVFFDVQIKGSNPITLDGATVSGATITQEDPYDDNYPFIVNTSPGDTVTLSVSATSDTGADLTYSWFGYGQIENNTNSYTFTVSKSSAPSYTCSITDGENWIYVNFSIVVDSGLTLSERETTGNLYDSSVYGSVTYYYYTFKAAPNSSVSLEVQVGEMSPEDLDDVTYQWFYSSDTESWNFEEMDGEESAALSAFTAAPGVYRCNITDGYHQTIEVYFTVAIDSGMTLTAAAGDKTGEQEDFGRHDYFYDVSTYPYSDVDLWVQVGPEDLEDVSYQWYVCDEQSGEWVALEGEDTEEYTASVENQYCYYYRCDIIDAYGGMISVYFNIYTDKSILENVYHTDYLRTTAEIPVLLKAMVGGSGEHTFVWYVRNGNTEYYSEIARTVALEGEDPEDPKLVELVVNPAEYTEYLLVANNSDNQWEGSLSFKVDIVPANQVVNQDVDFYTLTVGDTLNLCAPDSRYWYADDRWSVEGPGGADDAADNILQLAENGSGCTVTADAAGTAYVCWGLYSYDSVDEHGDPAVLAKLRCRIDVREVAVADAIAADDYACSVSLPVTAVTTNIYSKAYTQFEVPLVVEKVEVQSALFDQSDADPCNSGYTIMEAKFTNDDVSRLFSLHVADDRTLEIVPNINFDAPKAEIDKALASIKGPYKSTVSVWINDGNGEPLEEPLVTEKQLTITVKKTLPKVTASAVKFNSFNEYDNQPLKLSQKCESIRLDPDYAETQPNWLFAEFDSMLLIFSGARNQKYSGKLYLLVQPEQCAMEIPVTVPVKATNSAPKLKATGAITLNPWLMPYGETTITATPYNYSYSAPVVTKIVDGKTTWSGATLTAAPISVSTSEHPSWSLYTEICDMAYFNNSSTKAHTFKVTLSVGADAEGKGGATTVVTVKTVAANALPKLKLKGSGTIDTKIQGSPFTVTWSGSNLEGLYPEFSVHLYKDKGKTDLGPVNDPTTDPIFEVSQWGKSAVVYEFQPGTAPKPDKGYAYYVVVDLYREDTGELYRENAAAIKLGIKFSDTRAKITTTLKASGSIDLIRPDSKVTLTPGELKNCFTTSVGPQSLKFSTDKAGLQVLAYDQQSGVNETPFNIRMYGIWNAARQRYMPTFELTLKDECRGVVKTTDKFFVFIDMTADGQHVTTKPVQIKLTKSSPKITQTAKAVTLLKNDLFSYANIGINVPSGYSRIETVTLDAKSEARFDLVNNGGGNVELHRDPTNALTTKATVKLNVYLKGNTTGKPDKVLSVAVKFI